MRDEEKANNRCSETACCGLNRRLMSYPVTLGESVHGSWVFKDMLKSKIKSLLSAQSNETIAVVRRIHLSTVVRLHGVKTT